MLTIYLHHFSSYSQKAKVAFYEKGIDFALRELDFTEAITREFAELWPVQRFPVMTDGDAVVFEATCIAEYLDLNFPDTPRLIPSDPAAALDVRMWDRFFDNYVMYPVQRIVGAAIGWEPKDSGGVERAREMLVASYGILDDRMADREWAAGEDFTLADAASAPALLYADWTEAIPATFTHVHAYRARLLARPSYARALDEARPFRHLFPLGAPEGRD